MLNSCNLHFWSCCSWIRTMYDTVRVVCCTGQDVISEMQPDTEFRVPLINALFKRFIHPAQWILFTELQNAKFKLKAILQYLLPQLISQQQIMGDDLFCFSILTCHLSWKENDYTSPTKLYLLKRQLPVIIRGRKC